MGITNMDNATTFVWVDCADELPPDREIVMVWNTKYNGPRWGIRKGNRFSINGSRVKMSDQSHWARVPKPKPGLNVRERMDARPASRGTEKKT